MKLAIISRHFSKVAGGAESYSVHLATAMRGDYEITVVSQTFDEAEAGFAHIRVPRLPVRSRWINQLWFNWYTKRVTRGRFDLVHSHENVSHGDVQTVHVKTVHASLRERGAGVLRIALSPRLLAYLWLERQRLRGSRGQNVFVSQLLLDETQAALPGLAAGTVIAPGVNWPERELPLAQRSAARQALGLAPDTVVIGFVGHDFKKKGLDVLLRAVAQLPFEATVLVVGQPAQAASYQAQVAALGAGKQCRFLGVVRQMPAIYAALDCLAHPTTQDVFPMVLLEAMALGVPVITTLAPYNSMASLLTDRQEALLLKDPHDAGELARQLTDVARDESLRRHLVSAGRRFSRQYSWADVKAAYYRVYQAVLARPSRSS
jgi:UDP-glucose:(heptosyl)LPS alpha-1,3-glucosyltransferase